MREKEHTADYYYNQLTPSIEKTLTVEQKNEVKSVLKRAIRVPSKKILNIEITFWLLKSLYLVLYLGSDERKRSRSRMERGLKQCNWNIYQVPDPFHKFNIACYFIFFYFLYS